MDILSSYRTDAVTTVRYVWFIGNMVSIWHLVAASVWGYWAVPLKTLLEFCFPPAVVAIHAFVRLTEGTVTHACMIGLKTCDTNWHFAES